MSTVGSTPQEVHILDRLVLPVDEADPWLARWRTDYLPAARGRDMSPARVWQGHSGPDTVEVQVLWTVPGVIPFFAMRSVANADPRITEFWERTDAVAVERDRRVLRPVSDTGEQSAGRVPVRRTQDTSTAKGVRWVVHAAGAPDPAKLPSAVTDVSWGVDEQGSIGGQGATWDLLTDEPAPEVAATVEGAVALAPLAAHHVPLEGRRVKRTLFLAVRPGTDPDLVTRFEEDLLAMPRHISTIRSWSLSRVDQELSPSRWTHVWEQEYEDAAGLNGEYLQHPFHWTYVDRWFDSEVPGSIVEPRLAHLYRWADGPVLTENRP
ncbi:Dabb family protein [Streptomyces sp. NPDC046821]|uniref:Dabb family protein n=1 Tax=Streptomyces sp. NPDC046821 TaxID=3154702 RepID=UPI0034031B87